MEIQLSFDDAILQRYYGRGSRVLFELPWHHQGEIYPEKQWLDFGSVVLCWWTNAAGALLTGASPVSFSFMDGPYRLAASLRANAKVRVTAEEGTIDWELDLEELCREVLRATRQAAQELHRRGIRGPDVDQLREHANSLAAALERSHGGASSHR